MKITTKGRYGLRAMIDLAIHDDDIVSLHSIAQRQGLSDGYLEQLMGKLKKAGLIESSRGAAGGYRLSRDPAEISVGDILRALEGSIHPIDCPGLDAEVSCANADNCITKLVWKRIGDAIEDTVDHITLQEIKEQGAENCCGRG